MVSNNGSDAEFVALLEGRARNKAQEYYKLQHEMERIKVQLERTKAYIDKVNSLLEGEGQTPIPLREPRQGNGMGKIGNRAKDFPVRRTDWAGMTLDEIIKAILESSPNEILHADLIAHKIYEIQSGIDLRRVKMSLVSILRKGAKRGLWESKKRNRYKSKAVVQAQAKLVD